MADTLQEFLVALKYKQDEASQRRFLDGVKTTESKVASFTKTSAKVAGALAGMVGVAAKGTSDYAKGLEQVNFIAKRTNTTLANMVALQKTSASFGSSAGGAQGSLEGIASFMRNNPGASAFLSSIGVNEKDKKGKQRDSVAIMSDLASRFKEMPVWRANQYAQMLGIDENTMLAMRSKGFDASLKKYRSIIGDKADRAANSSHALMNQERVLGTKVFADKADAMTCAMDLLTKTVTALNNTESPYFDWAMKVYATDAATGHPIEKVGGGLLGWMFLKKLFSRGAAGAAGEAGIAASGIGFGGLAVGLGALMAPSSTQSDEQEQSELKKYTGQYKDLLHSRQKIVVDRLVANGMTKEQAIVMAAGFQQESTVNGLPFNPHASNAGHLGIAQWDKARQALFYKHMGFPVQAAGLNDQIDFAAWEIKQRPEWKKMMAHPHDIPALNNDVTRDYESPGNYTFEVPHRLAIAEEISKNINSQQARWTEKVASSGSTVNNNGAQITQHMSTTVHVKSTDPKLTAKEVEKAQIHVAQQAARNSAGAHR